MKKFIYSLTLYVFFITPSFGAIQYEIVNLVDSTNSYTPGVDTGNITDTQVICVEIKKTGGDVAAPNDYKVTGTSANASGTIFRVFDSISTYVAYEVDWHDTIDQTGTTTNLDSGVQSGAINNANPSNNCGGGNSASFSVIFTQANMEAGIGGTYTDTLTILISPV